MKYNVTIIETLTRTVEVESSCEGEAYRKVRKCYDDEEYVLGAEDFADVSFSVDKVHE